MFCYISWTHVKAAIMELRLFMNALVLRRLFTISTTNSTSPFAFSISNPLFRFLWFSFQSYTNEHLICICYTLGMLFLMKLFQIFIKRHSIKKKIRVKRALKKVTVIFFKQICFIKKKHLIKKSNVWKTIFFIQKKSIPSDIYYSPMDYTIVRAGHFTTILV